MKIREYQICQRCTMDTTDPDIVFDKDSICNHCTAALSRMQAQLLPVKARKSALEGLVEKIKFQGKGKPYDCIIGVSGGVDSTAVAYYVKELGLRPLAVHFDNGWDSELAVDNIKKSLEALKIELLTHVVDWEEFKDLQLCFLKASVANCEIPTDHAINALLFHPPHGGLRSLGRHLCRQPVEHAVKVQRTLQVPTRARAREPHHQPLKRGPVRRGRGARVRRRARVVRL